MALVHISRRLAPIRRSALAPTALDRYAYRPLVPKFPGASPRSRAALANIPDHLDVIAMPRAKLGPDALKTVAVHKNKNTDTHTHSVLYIKDRHTVCTYTHSERTFQIIACHVHARAVDCGVNRVFSRAVCHTNSNVHLYTKIKTRFFSANSLVIGTLF